MSQSRFILAAASNGVRHNVWFNGFLLASEVGEAAVAVQRRLEPFMVAGGNDFEVELADPGPPPEDETKKPHLDAGVYLVDPSVSPNEFNLLVKYVYFSRNDLRDILGFQTVLRHVFTFAKSRTPRAWEAATPIRAEDAAGVLQAGLAEVRRAVDGASALGSLLELHAQDHSAITSTSLEESMDDLGAGMLAGLSSGAARVTFASAQGVTPVLRFDGHVVQGRARSGGPLLTIEAGNTRVGVSPAFSMIDGAVRVVRWS